MKKIFRFFTILITIIAIIGMICGGLFLYAFHIEPHRLSSEEFDISEGEVNEPVKIAVFADTHFGHDYGMPDFQEAIAKINDASPDFIFFLGDLFDNFNNYEGNAYMISQALATLDAPMGKYAVFGNHDYGGGAENQYEGIMSAGGFTVLKNESVSFPEKNITLTGIDDCLLGYGNTGIAKNLNAERYNIVLCHEPDVIDEILDTEIDLMISGHTHGGQVNIPFYTSKYLPPLGEKYVKGDYTFDNDAETLLYVNSGLGTTKITARFMAVPVITYITVDN